MKKEGFPRFSMTAHTNFWKETDARNNAKGYGVKVEGTWYWYDNWVEQIRKHCQESGDLYR